MELMFNDMHAQVDMTQYIKDCVDVPRIIKGCQGCKNYAKLWSCPPFGFDPVKIWRDYSKLTLYARKISFPKELTEKTFDAYGLTAQYFEIWNKERRKFFIELMEREQSTPGSLMLAAGCCDECATCARANGTFFPGCPRGTGCNHSAQVPYLRHYKTQYNPDNQAARWPGCGSSLR